MHCFPFDLACVPILLLQDVKLDLALLIERKGKVREAGSVSNVSRGKGIGYAGQFTDHLSDSWPLQRNPF